MSLILGSLFVIIGVTALCGKNQQTKPAWAKLIYEEHKQKLLDRS